jgi:hypothetical protein
MKKVIFILFLPMLFPAFVYGQSDSLGNDRDQLEFYNVNTKPYNTKPSIKERFDSHFEIGTMFSYSPGIFYGPSYFVSPSLSYQVSPRFILSTTVGLKYSMLYPIYQQTEGDPKMLPMTQTYLYTRGSYYITPSFVINGMVYEDMMNAPPIRNNTDRAKYNCQGMSVGFQYHVSKSFSFGFGMHMRNSKYQPYELIPASGYVPVMGF